MVLGVRRAAAAKAQELLAKRVSLDLKAMAPAEAFKVLADAVGTTVTVDPAVTSAGGHPGPQRVCADRAQHDVREHRLPVDGRRGRDRDHAWTARNEAGRRIQTAAARGRLNGDSLRVLLKQPLPPGMKFENAPLETVSARLSEALKTRIAISTDDKTPRTVTADFSSLTLQAGIKMLLEQSGESAAWRITFAGPDGETSPSLAIMVGGRPTKAMKK